MPSPDYTITVKSYAGSTLVADLPVETLEYSTVLDSPGSCSVDLLLDQAAATMANLPAGGAQLEVSRGGTPRWGGWVWSSQASLESQRVSLSADGWTSRLRHRVFDDSRAFFGAEQFNIAWSLIDYTQAKANGGLGITRDGGEVPSGITRKRLYCCHERVTILDALEELAFADDGFDFEVTPAKVWKVYYPRRGTASSHVFSTGTGPGVSNVWGLSLDIDGSELVNNVGVMPQNDVCTDIEVLTNSGSITAYGLMEETLTSDAKHVDDRRAEGREYVRMRNQPRWSLSIVTPDVPWDSPAYDIGDTVTVDADVGFATINQAFRVMSWRVQVQEGQEQVQLFLDSVGLA